jgi:wyosine [tRNA(Phe)-imidazoG37] synthetase (radical SAM superfamily)
MIEGLVDFRSRYDGQIWAEVMLVAGLNDTEPALLDLRKALDRIAPDRVYVNVPIRPPAEPWVTPPDAAGLVRAHAILGEAVFIDRPEAGTFSTDGFEDPVEAVMMIVRRHPMRRDQIEATLGDLAGAEVDQVVDRLVSEGRVQEVAYRGQTYLATGSGRYAVEKEGSRRPQAQG